MLGPITLLTLREKILTIEADRHGFGWTTLPASMYVVSVDGHHLRHQVVPRPAGLAATDPPHLHAVAYAAAARAEAFAVAGVAVAACFIAELCPGCLHSRLPRPVHRLWHARWHQPTVRVAVAVDVAGARYYLQRDRDDDRDVALYISPPPEPGSVRDGDVAVLLYRSMIELLANWRSTTGHDTGLHEAHVEAAPQRRTPKRGEDLDDGVVRAGRGGDCADHRHTAESDNGQARHAGAPGGPDGTTRGVHSG